MTFQKRTDGAALWAAALLVGAWSLGAAAQEKPRPGVDWPQFRGIAASGVADGFPLPARWNIETGENVRWNVTVPGLAHSSPIIWRDMVCVTTAVAQNKEEVLKVGLYGDITPVDDA